MNYRASLYREVRVNLPECATIPYSMYARHLPGLYDVLSAPGASSIFGRVADGDFKYYYASWSFNRWAMDRYGTSEAAYLRAIAQSTTTGMTSIVAVTGRPIAEMLGNWTLSQYLDDNTSNLDLSVPSGNLHDVFAGMHTDFGTSFPRSYPLEPVVLPFGAFTMDNAGIHGGSFAMYSLPVTGTAARTVGLSANGGVQPHRPRCASASRARHETLPHRHPVGLRLSSVAGRLLRAEQRARAAR